MAHTIRTTPLALAVALAALSACDAARPIAPPAGAEESGEALAGCTRCHGDAARAEDDALLRAAPPATVSGRPAGAHAAHLHGGTFRAALACAECHAVPTSAAHADGALDLPFGALARARGAAPAYADGTCSGVYCHGATLAAGGDAVAPSWTGTVGCTGCHAFPPPSHDPAATGCASCHPGTVNADGTLNLAGGLHVNGALDVENVHAAGWTSPSSHGRAASSDLDSCRACHGAELDGPAGSVTCDDCHAAAGYAEWRTNCTFCHGTQVATYDPADLPLAAPPTGTQGETATSARAVGAHQAHLAGGALAVAVACTECHASLPVDLSHVDGTARVTFGAGATRGGATPAWNGTTCAASYCHGGTLDAGGTNREPSWTGGPAEAACGTCHGLPPPAPHSTSAACGGCHPGYGPGTVVAATHVDGKLDLGAMSCTSCHGQQGAAATAASPLAAAPPVDTSGATTGARVGAHQKHLSGGAFGNALPCATCHASVGTYTLGHADGTRQVAFTGAANANLARGSWDPGSGTCSATWCHGAVISRTGGASGGTQTAPAWTASVTACTSCHAVSMSSLPNRHNKHSGKAACGDCHAGYAASSVNLALHVNGSKDLGGAEVAPTATATSCANACHGTKSWF